MKFLGLNRKEIVFIITGFLLAILILKAVLFFTARPKVTVNYVSVYNRITRPQNYAPKENAAPYYQQAFDAFVETPEKLPMLYYINWPTDYNNDEQVLFEKWLISNTLAFDYFREALNKPYYWIRRTSTEDNIVDDMNFSDDSKLLGIAKALIWDAKLKASKGQFQAAFKNILDSYRAGNYKCRSKLFLIEQYCGLSIKNNALRGALTILDKSKVENESLKFLQNSLEEERKKDDYLPGLDTEKLKLYDWIQRLFVDNGKGTGRLVFKGFDAIMSLYYGESNDEQVWLNSFFGPTRNETTEQIEQTIALYEQIKNKTPWQIHKQGLDNFAQIRAINQNNFLLKYIGLDPQKIFQSCYRLRAEIDGLIVVLALLRYKADTGQYPESLDKLVSAGYLQSVPMDPYSDGPLVYKVTENNFKLYSVGENFVDDGGETYHADIVYWPVKKPEKLKPLSEIEEEPETMQEISDANEPK